MENKLEISNVNLKNLRKIKLRPGFALGKPVESSKSLRAQYEKLMEKAFKE